MFLTMNDFSSPCLPKVFSPKRRLRRFETSRFLSMILKDSRVHTRTCGPWTITIEMMDERSKEEQGDRNVFPFGAFSTATSLSHARSMLRPKRRVRLGNNRKAFVIDTDWRIPPVQPRKRRSKHLPIVVPLGYPCRGKSERKE